MTTEKKKTRFFSLKIKIWLAFNFVFTPVFVLSYIWFYQYTSKSVFDTITLDLTETVDGAINGMDVEGFLQLFQEESTSDPRCIPELDAEENGYYPENSLYWEHVEWLRTVQSVAPTTRMYTYIDGIEEGEIIAIGSTGVFRDPRGGFRFCQRYTSTSSRIYDGLTERVDAWEEYDDQEFGNWITTYMPITDANGDPVGAIGVDISADYVGEVRGGILRSGAIAFIGSYLLITILIFVTSNIITKPLLNLTGVAEQIGEGNYDLDISDQTKHSDFMDEIDKLSSVFEIMLSKVRKREQTLRKRVSQLEIMIDNTKREEEVKQIVDSDFFQDLQSKAKDMRQQFKGDDKK
ncbi:MAG: hypothetical protein GY755_18950 [Chloroflexi bacterium]|nr:hypothetical protein [Chloroflexota bacterium]